MRKPVDEELSLDQRKLAAQIFNRIIKKPRSRKNKAKEIEKAWFAFGKPGRDPLGLSSVVQSLAADNGWTPHLKVAELGDHWDQIVGSNIAEHSRVVSYESGRLIIQARTTVWATQLTYLIPSLKGRISDCLAMPVDEIVVTGPRNYDFSQDGHGRRYPYRRRHNFGR